MVVDDLSNGRRTNVPPQAELVRLDIGDPTLVGVAKAFRPDAVTHCAAQASVAVSMAKPVHDAAVNILGGINVCQAAIAAGCTQLVYITTGGALYGPADYLPCDEDHPVRPASAYGLSKWTLECYLRILLPPSIPFKVLRLANIYGPRQDPNGEAGVVAIFGSRMVRHEPVVIFGDGEQTRDFVYVADVVRAHELALSAPSSLTVNISSSVPLSINHLFQLVSAEAGYRQGPLYQSPRPGDIKHSVLANSRAKRLLGWKPTTSLLEGLRATLGWIRDEGLAGRPEPETTGQGQGEEG